MTHFPLKGVPGGLWSDLNGFCIHQATQNSLLMDTLMIYFLVVIISTGILVALFLRFRYAEANFESKIIGIWTNESNTMRVLIYGINSHYQGDVIWTRNMEEKVLGLGVIRNMIVKYSSFGEGLYVDPLTRHQFKLRLKLKNKEELQIQLYDKFDQHVKKELAWHLVKTI
jgi:hypothetical protein